MSERPSDRPSFLRAARALARTVRDGLGAARGAGIDVYLGARGRRARARDLPLRVLVVADARGATLHLGVVVPLRRLCGVGACALHVVTEAELAAAATAHPRRGARDLLARAVGELGGADVLVCSRYAGAEHAAVLAFVRRRGLPLVAHLDDDLLGVPADLGRAKHRRYNDPARLVALRAVLESSDRVYASTPPLADALRARGISRPIDAGELYCAASEPFRAPRLKAPLDGQELPEVRLGYMGTSGHTQDLAMVAPAVFAVLEAHPNVTFQTFGNFERPPVPEPLRARVSHVEPVKGYDEFLARLRDVEWDVALAPLRDTSFNRCKTDTKWVECTIAGAAVVASDLVVYRGPCAGRRGLLVRDDGWRAAIESLVLDAPLRSELVASAQAELRARYSADRVEAQLLGVLSRAGVAVPAP